MNPALQMTAKLDTEPLADLMRQAGKKLPTALMRAVNHTGDKTRTAMIAALTAQTGLKKKTIVKALKKSLASLNTPAYSVACRGGNISVMHFNAKETRAGVVAKPDGVSVLYPHAFMKAGGFPNRINKPNWHGQVFERAGGKTGTGKDKFLKVRFNVFIPDEMVTGKTKAAFKRVINEAFPARLKHELVYVLGGPK